MLDITVTRNEIVSAPALPIREGGRYDTVLEVELADAEHLLRGRREIRTAHGTFAREGERVLYYTPVDPEIGAAQTRRNYERDLQRLVSRHNARNTRSGVLWKDR